MKNNILILSFACITLSFGQTYMAGDIISSTHQNTAFDVCYGDYPSDEFHFGDLNGAINGGSHYITFVDMAATW